VTRLDRIVSTFFLLWGYVGITGLVEIAVHTIWRDR
jgi:hypothetical protein